MDIKPIILIKFRDIFDIIQLQIINQINQLNLMQENNFSPKNKDIKRIIQYNVIHQICETLINEKSSSKKVIFIDPFIINNNFEIFNYCNFEHFKIYLQKTLKEIDNKLPINLYIAQKDFDYYLDNKENGEYLELLSNLNILIDNNALKNKSFKDIKRYARKKGLTFLKEQYFNELSTKILLI
jgi:hypothetical protein